MGSLLLMLLLELLAEHLTVMFRFTSRVVHDGVTLHRRVALSSLNL